MDIALVIARIVHVLGGIMWVGSMFFVSTFLGPTVAEMGPDGGRVMAGLAKRNWMIFVPAAAILTMLAGLYLYWHVSAGFQPVYMSSGPGMTYGIGAAAAILSFVIGMTVTRPSMVKVMQLGQQMATADAPDRQRISETMARYRSRSETGSKVVITLLLVAVLAMAVGRYVN
jgi:uncharacterized membrane protein